jgi:hypothetical protein
MTLLPTSRFALRMKDGRLVFLAWDFAAMFAEESARLLGQTVTIEMTLFFMTRSAENAPELEEIRAAIRKLGNAAVLELPQAIGATRRLALTGGLPEKESPPKASVPTQGEPPRLDWSDLMQRACAAFNITPAEFWKLTPFEFNLRMRAARERHRFTAQMTAHLLNVAGKRLRHPVDADDLLGIAREDSAMPFASELSEADRSAAIERIWQKVQRQRQEGKVAGGQA